MIRDAAAALRRLVATQPDRAAALLLAAMAYIPMLLTRPGRVSADTKVYLTVDPGDVLSSATSMWDPSVGAGTVPHQNIGYLFPLGPYYWVMGRVGSPDWLAQRLLWATMIFAAAWGMYRLVRWLGWSAAGALVAAVAYGFSPYLLSYLARLSVILGPWAAMPWMILLAAQAVRTGSWRPPAWFAATVALVGSVNATSLVLAGLGPLIWVLADTFAGRVAWRSALAGVARIGALCLGVSAWWIVGLQIQGSRGLPILRYTETYQAVAAASTAPEVLRGLGYWFFYGGDRLDPWVGPSLSYIDQPIVIAFGFIIAGLSLLGLLWAFSGRAVAVVMLLVGLAVSVGAAPLGSSSLYGALFETFASESTVGAALRSTPRAAPLVILALALGLGSLSERLRTLGTSSDLRSQRRSLAPPAAAIGLLMLQMFPWFTGTALSESLLRDETLPAPTTDLATWLDDPGGSVRDGRVYALPGADFAYQRWGGTIDPVLPGLTDRSVLYSELVPQGGFGTADLLNGFERRMWEGWYEPQTLTPIAEMLGIETVVIRNDLEHERFRLARPGAVWTDVTSALGSPDRAVAPTTDTPRITYVDEITLARDDLAENFPTLGGFDLEPAPLLVARSADTPTVVAGSGDGLVDLAGAGLLDTDRPVLYAATLDSENLGVPDGAWFVVTDTNRKQGRHWSTLGSNLGALEGVGPLVLDDDPGNGALDVFGEAESLDTDDQTIGVHVGDVADVQASYYGGKVIYTAEDAPWFAMDGDSSTAWRVGVFEDVEGLVWRGDLVTPSDASNITLLQPVTGATSRFITAVDITLDGERTVRATLDESSRTLPGQQIDLPDGPFTSVEIRIVDDNLGPLASYSGQPGVGFAEITIPGVVDDRVVRTPRISGVGADQRLTYVLTRQRLDPATPNRQAPEPTLVRQFEVPVGRTFTLAGDARLSPGADDVVLSELLGDSAAAVADRRLAGSVSSRGAAAADGDVTTAWQTPFDDPDGNTLTVSPAGPVDTDSIAITWRNDDQHAAPTQFRVDAGDGPVTLDVADDAVDTGAAGLTTATFDVPGFSADRFTVTVAATDGATVPEYFSGFPRRLPVAIVEIDTGSGLLVTTPPTIDSGCRSDLLTLDGEAVAVRLGGSTDDAVSGRALTLESCDGSISLAAGDHRLDTAPGAPTGFDIDRIVLDSDPTTAETGQVQNRVSSDDVPVTIADIERTSIDATLPPTESDRWLTMRQSWNSGWTLSVDGNDLGAPTLIDGYANGWLVPAGDSTRSIELRWTPQRTVDIALVLSAVFGLLVLALLVLTRRHAPLPLGTRDVEHERTGRRADVILAGALVVGLALAAGPLAALLALLIVTVRRRSRLMAAGALGVLGGAVAVGIVGLEWRRDYAAGPDWPSNFAWATPLTWAVVGAVAAAVLVSRTGDRADR